MPLALRKLGRQKGTGSLPLKRQHNSLAEMWHRSSSLKNAWSILEGDLFTNFKARALKFKFKFKPFKISWNFPVPIMIFETLLLAYLEIVAQVYY